MKTSFIPFARIICIILFVISGFYAIEFLLFTFQTVFSIAIEKKHIVDVGYFGIELSDWTLAFFTFLVAILAAFIAFSQYMIIRLIKRKQVSNQTPSGNPAPPSS